MAWGCKILADSLADNGARLTTFELTYPRLIHAEVMTHRALPKNAASSRAIPVEKMIRRVQEDPAMPVFWGKNQSGMQAYEELDLQGKLDSIHAWLDGRDEAVKIAERLVAIGAHKQIVNRVLEPYMWITVIISGTEWGNFFNLRCAPDAQPEFQKLAKTVRNYYYSSTPVRRTLHLPMVTEEEFLDLNTTVEDLKKISVGRCARVSYLTHDGKRDLQADIDLHDKLVDSGHWSPFEHVATSQERSEWSGPFFGWDQYRKTFENENRSHHDYDPFS